MNNANPLESLSSIIAQVTLDLAECVNCRWAVAMYCFGSSVAPICAFGNNPDLERSFAHTCTLLSKHPHNTDKSDVLLLPISEDWAPRVVSPIRVRGKTLGALVLGPKNVPGEYSVADYELIRGLTEHLVFLLNHDRLAAKVGREIARLQRTKLELDSARQVQQGLFPRQLELIRDLDYYGECQPSSEVGGDFFDFVAAEHSLLVSIGDVSGKGVPAAIVMAGLQASLRVLDGSHAGGICDLVRNLNHVALQLAPYNFYATMFCARINCTRRAMQYVNAGHDRVFLLRHKGRRAVTLDSTGGVIGLSSRTTYTQRTVGFEAGDILVGLTDGITEAADLEGHVLEKLIRDVVADHSDESSSSLTGYIIQAVDALTRGETPADDRTVVVVRFVPEMAAAYLNGLAGVHALAHVA